MMDCIHSRPLTLENGNTTYAIPPSLKTPSTSKGRAIDLNASSSIGHASILLFWATGNPLPFLSIVTRPSSNWPHSLATTTLEKPQQKLPYFSPSCVLFSNFVHEFCFWTSNQTMFSLESPRCGPLDSKRSLGCPHFGCIVQHTMPERLAEVSPFCNFWGRCWNFPKPDGLQCTEGLEGVS